MARSIARFWRNESGATAIEYGLIAALVVIAMITALTLFADEVNEMYNYVSSNFSDAAD